MHATVHAAPTADIRPEVHARRWRILAVLAVSLMVITIDTTILNVALPTLARDLHASTSSLQWIVDAYTLVFAALLLTAGSLGDRFGRRGALAAGLAIFGIGSLAAGLTGSAGALIAARCLMGVGGAFIMPTTLSICTNVFVDPSERAKAIAVWTGVAGIGVAIGPLAGGFLLEHFSWSSVFFVNVPLCLVTLLCVVKMVPTSKDPSAGRLDLPGQILSIVALSTLVYGIIEAPSHGWTSPEMLVVWAVAAISGASFVAWERRTSHPMLDVSVFRNARFSAASGAITLVHFAVFGAIFVLATYLQAVLGYSALQAGVRTLPFAVAMAAVSSIAPMLVQRFGTKLVVCGGLVTMAGGLLTAAHSSPTSGYSLVFVSMLVMGAGMALAMAPATESIMGSLPKEKAGVGSAVNDTTREVGGALGVAVLGSIFSTTYGHAVITRLAGSGLPDKVVHALSDSIGAAGSLNQQGPAADHVRAAVGSAFIHGMDVTLTLAAGFILVGALVAALFLPARAEATTENEAEEVAPLLAAA